MWWWHEPVSTNLFVFSFSPIVLNRQTGLYEQTVRLTNGSVNTIEAARLLIQALPSDVQVYNASGSDSGTPFVQYGVPLPPAASVDLVIEYYRWSRVQITQPSFVAVDGTSAPVNDTGTVIQIDRNVQFDNGRFIIEFSSIPGGHYAVQYTSDMETWKTATPIITAPANKVQWYNDGPPKPKASPPPAAVFTASCNSLESRHHQPF